MSRWRSPACLYPHWPKPQREYKREPPQVPGLASLERGAILEALARSHGKIYGATGAAAALGLKPTTLYGKMRKHKIPKHPPPV